ncbi:hypothetical protein Thermus71206_21960 [Thermus antranikianii]
MNWEAFFLKGTPVLALPNWESPRLFVAAWGLRTRWEGSGLYPGYRWSARAFRLFLRIGAALGVGAIRVAREGWALEPFLSRAGRKDLVPRAVLIGTKGPAQKTIVELCTQEGRVSAYLKYGETDAARRRISCEYAVLQALPRDLAPEPLHLGPVGEGIGLLLSAVRGKPVAARASLPEDVFRYAASLPISGYCAAEAHPWIGRLLAHGGGKLGKWLRTLESREWAVLPQHGDFAPWNLLRDHHHVRAIDWEYGVLEGFPGADLAYYLLQVGALIHRWSPKRTRAHAAHALARLPWPGVSLEEAETLVRLTAYDAYLKAMEDGHGPEEPLQAWRRAVWEET